MKDFRYGEKVKMSSVAIQENVPGCLQSGIGTVMASTKKWVGKDYVDVKVGVQQTTYHKDYVEYV